METQPPLTSIQETIVAPIIPPPPQHAEIPNAPTLEDLEKLFESNNVDPLLRMQAQLLTEALRNQGVQSLDFKTLAALASVYMKVADSRKKLIREVDRMRQFYLVDVILTQMTEDALAPEIGTGNVLSASSAREDIQTQIDLLEEKIDFDQLALTITPDMLAYGEYTLEAVVVQDKKVNDEKDPLVKKDIEELDPKDQKNQANVDDCYDDETGLVDVLDSVDQASIVAITKWGDIKCYLVQNEKGQVERRHASEFIKFSLSSSRLRIDLFKEFNLSAAKMKEKKCQDIPRYVRVGRSIIYPIISKLKELEILEALVPATKISKLSSGSMVGVQVPPGYDVQKGMEAAKQVEQLLNKKIGIDGKMGEITVENIMSTAGRIKAVPIFGEKGQLSKMDYQSDEPEKLLESVVDVRKTICSSVGLPYELIFGSDEEKKGTVLRKYSRYLRKLKAVQKAVEEGVRQIIYIHLSNKGIDYTTNDIKVEFYNKLIEVDNLDRLEFMDSTVGFLDNIKRFVMEMADVNVNPKFAERIHLEGFLEFLNSQLNTVGLPNIIDVDGDGEAEGREEDDPTIKIGGTPGSKDSDSPVDKRGGTVTPSSMVRRKTLTPPKPDVTVSDNGNKVSP